MKDYYLTRERWALIANLLPGKDGDPGRHGRDNRLFIEAVFWIARTDSPWRSLPPHFGKWYTNYTRFRRWMLKGVWPNVLDALNAEETCQYFLEDGEIRHRPGVSPEAQSPQLASRNSGGANPEFRATA